MVKLMAEEYCSYAPSHCLSAPIEIASFGVKAYTGNLMNLNYARYALYGVFALALIFLVLKLGGR